SGPWNRSGKFVTQCGKNDPPALEIGRGVWHNQRPEAPDPEVPTMARTPAKGKPADAAGNGSATPAALRQPAEVEYAAELAALKAADRDPRPEGWQLSPKAARTYVLGGKAGGTEIRPKYMGNARLVEIAIATLATDRALLLVGEPGTAKSYLSEHLAAAVSGD